MLFKHTGGEICWSLPKPFRLESAQTKALSLEIFFLSRFIFYHCTEGACYTDRWVIKIELYIKPSLLRQTVTLSSGSPRLCFIWTPISSSTTLFHARPARLIIQMWLDFQRLLSLPRIKLRPLHEPAGLSQRKTTRSQIFSECTFSRKKISRCLAMY